MNRTYKFRPRNKRTRFVRGKRRGRNRKYFKLPAIISSKPQRLGPGSANAVCDYMYNFEHEDTDVHYINLGDVVLNGTEYLLYKNLYQYMRINLIRVISFPHNVGTGTQGVYFQLQYRYVPETNNLELDDCSKYVSIFQPRFRVFNFTPPNVTNQTFDNSVYNFSEWLPTKITATSLPMSLLFKKDTTGAVLYKFRIEVYISFRGANITPSATALKSLLLQNEKDSKMIADVTQNGTKMIKEEIIEKDNKIIKEEIDKMCEEISVENIEKEESINKEN